MRKQDYIIVRLFIGLTCFVFAIVIYSQFTEPIPTLKQQIPVSQIHDGVPHDDDYLINLSELNYLGLGYDAKGKIINLEN